MLTINWEPGFFVHRRIRSAVKKVEFISDRVSCITLKGRWCDIIVLNVHAPTEDKNDDIKDSLGPRGMRMRSGGGSTMRNFIVCTFT